MSRSVLHGAVAECESVDKLPPQLRALVHEFGFSVVKAFLDAGVTKPSSIRHLVHIAWLGAREPGNKRRAPVDGTNKFSDQVDDYLIQQGVQMNVRGFVRLLRQANFVMLPRAADHPICEREGISATAITKYIQIFERQLWPDLSNDGAKGRPGR